MPTFDLARDLGGDVVQQRVARVVAGVFRVSFTASAPTAPDWPVSGTPSQKQAPRTFSSLLMAA